MSPSWASMRSSMWSNDGHSRWQRRQPSHSSVTRASSFSTACVSKKDGSRGSKVMVLARRNRGPVAYRPAPRILQLLETLEALREAAGVAALGLGQRLEPLGDFREALVAGGLRHARVHLRVLVRLALDRGLQVLAGVAEADAGRGI